VIGIATLSLRQAHEPVADAAKPAERRPLARPGLLIGAGVLFIFGGETLCILGPMGHEATVHGVCHVILYSGIGMAGLGSVLYWVGKRNTRAEGSHGGAG
jgi:hypothetical protein